MRKALKQHRDIVWAAVGTGFFYLVDLLWPPVGDLKLYASTFLVTIFYLRLLMISEALEKLSENRFHVQEQ